MLYLYINLDCKAIKAILYILYLLFNIKLVTGAFEQEMYDKNIDESGNTCEWLLFGPALCKAFTEASMASGR